MCEFCVRHGDGKKWYEVVTHYSMELYSQEDREQFTKNFFEDVQRSAALQFSKLSAAKMRHPHAYRFMRRAATWNMKRLHFGQVVPLEDAEEILRSVSSVTRVPCVCRGATRGENDARYCFLLAIDPAGIFGDYPDLRKSLETLDTASAVELVREFDQEGLVHSIWTFKTPFIGGLCNCDHDCLAYRIQVTSDLMQMMFRAEYVASVEPLLCTGCRSCIERCRFDAIEYSAADAKCSVNLQRCYGCGVCRAACHQDAIMLTDRKRTPGLADLW